MAVTAQLKDLIQPTRVVSVNGDDYTLHPITVRQFAEILERFPEFTDLLNTQSSMATIVRKMPVIVPAMIAASLRQPDAEQAADQLSFQVQVDFIEKIAEITIPDGVRPLIETLTKIAIGSGNQQIDRQTHSLNS